MLCVNRPLLLGLLDYCSRESVIELSAGAAVVSRILMTLM
jgi:hypothetical protein